MLESLSVTVRRRWSSGKAGHFVPRLFEESLLLIRSHPEQSGFSVISDVPSRLLLGKCIGRQIMVVDKSNCGEGQILLDRPGTESIFNPAGIDRGPAPFDVTHDLRVNTIYHFPNFTQSRYISKVTDGWWMGGILSVQSGYPFSVTLGPNGDRTFQNNEQTTARPNYASGANVVTGNGLTTPWFNPAAFVLPAAGHLGTEGRNVLRGPGFTNLDFSLDKDTKVGWLGEAGEIQFRAEVFNAFNRPNFGLPNATLTTAGVTTAPPGAGPVPASVLSPTAGIISSTINGARQIQFALKLIF